MYRAKVHQPKGIICRYYPENATQERDCLSLKAKRSTIVHMSHQRLQFQVSPKFKFKQESFRDQNLVAKGRGNVTDQDQ